MWIIYKKNRNVQLRKAVYSTIYIIKSMKKMNRLNKNNNFVAYVGWWAGFNSSYHNCDIRYFSTSLLLRGNDAPLSLAQKNDNIFIDPWFVTGFTDAFIPHKVPRFTKKFSTKRVNNNLSLVIWGQNLPSSVGSGRFTKQESNMIQLPPFIKSVIIGLLLSDGWLSIASKTNHNARLGLKQSLSQSSYVWFVFNILSHYCSSYPNLTRGIRLGTPVYGLQFFTRSLSCFTELHSLFYIKGVKEIPKNIYELLTPVALAHWICGDGNALRHGLILCTNSYSIQDVTRLMNVLMIRHRLECSITVKKQSITKKVEFLIYIRHGSIPLLRTIVKPYMHSSFLYKLQL